MKQSAYSGLSRRQALRGLLMTGGLLLVPGLARAFVPAAGAAPYVRTGFHMGTMVTISLARCSEAQAQEALGIAFHEMRRVLADDGMNGFCEIGQQIEPWPVHGDNAVHDTCCPHRAKKKSYQHYPCLLHLSANIPHTYIKPPYTYADKHTMCPTDYIPLLSKDALCLVSE